MTWSGELQLAVDALSPHLVAVALISSRLLPVAFLCPLLGGAQVPMHVKLGLVLALAVFVHGAGGISAEGVSSLGTLAATAGRELMLGTTLGMVAALPFDAARMGGRFTDLFRGSSAEAALPLAGTREAASGDALHHLLLSIAASGAAMPLVLGALFKSFAAVKLGHFSHTEPATMLVVSLVGTAFCTGLAVGAPIAGLSLAVDALVGLAARAAPSMNLQEVSSPLKILGGGAALWLMVGVVAQRLLDGVLGTPEVMARLFEAAR